MTMVLASRRCHTVGMLHDVYPGARRIIKRDTRRRARRESRHMIEAGLADVDNRPRRLIAISRGAEPARIKHTLAEHVRRVLRTT